MRIHMLLALLTSILSHTHTRALPTIAVIIFSKDRPLQLDACLHSLHDHLTGATDVVVLYTGSDDQYRAAYGHVAHTYPAVRFVQEPAQTGGFTQALKDLCRGLSPDYIMFGVDDNIVMKPINVVHQAQMLEQHKAYGYFNRLGRNIDSCYSAPIATHVPPLTRIDHTTCSFVCSEGTADWNYPNTVDMTLYRWKDVAPFVYDMPYTNPNTFEGRWATHTQPAARYHHKALCSTVSTITNLPMNRVQTTWLNRHENSYSPEELLALYLQGYRIDLGELYTHVFNAPHSSYTPKLITMSSSPV